MYHWISAYLPEKHAVLLAALVYAVMLLLVLYFSFEQEADLNYLRL